MNGIGFKNMKVFKEEQWFDFKPITLLTGTNNSGKSSIINAMQMLQENITAKDIDTLIKTEFKLKKNQNKFGSIDTFTSNIEARDVNDNFGFIRKIGEIEYRIKIEIKDGLESFGIIKAIYAKNHKTNIDIFSLVVKNPYPRYKCILKINYEYFVQKLVKKIKNTQLLHQRIKELNLLIKKVNNNEINSKELIDFANKISEELSVYVSIINFTDEISLDENGDMKAPDNKTNYHYWINDNNNNDVSENILKTIDEIGVLFKSHEKNNRPISNNKVLVTESELETLYINNIKNGIFNISYLFHDQGLDKYDFEESLKAYYENDIEKAYNLLDCDIIKLLSNTYWEFEDNHYDEDPLLVPKFVTKAFIESIPEFGFLPFMFTRTKNEENAENEEEKNILASHFISGKAIIDNSNTLISGLFKKDFFNEIFSKISNIILKNINNTTNQKSDLVSLLNSIRFINPLIYENINKEINKTLLDLNLTFNNTYVSSNRFIAKRTYSFNDDTDFTNLLKQIESSNFERKSECKNFIKKWLNEFDIAEDLILKSDKETGNFKAYLLKKEIETPLADYGLGTNQLLPIIFSLGIHRIYWDHNVNDEIFLPRTVVIEEPESNLHPAMQSKLADLFVDAHKTFRVQVIAETHSEYLIRKLQYLVGTTKSDLISNDVVIYYFYKPDHKAVLNKQVNQIEKIEIDDYGCLSKEFGSGFFDEADRISMDVFMLKFSQNN
jgi:predicted ATPase